MYSIWLYWLYPLQVMMACSVERLATPTMGRLESWVVLSDEAPTPVEAAPELGGSPNEVGGLGEVGWVLNGAEVPVAEGTVGAAKLT